jgi:hypothetical protein
MNNTLKSALIKIVYDSGKKKLRAQAPDGGFIRFPNDLRNEGCHFLVDLIPGKNGSWIVSGPIRPVAVLKAIR